MAMTPDEKRAYNAAWKRKKYAADAEFRETNRKKCVAYTAERRATDPDFRERTKKARRERYRAMTDAEKADYIAKVQERRASKKAERTNP
jgi:hypothetical protein